MGQHKHNPNCKLAKEGKLPPKKQKMSEAELRQFVYETACIYILKRLTTKKGKDNE